MRQMKDSGIEWIGEIPQAWDANRLRNLIVRREGGVWGLEPDDYEQGTICLRVADFNFGKGRFVEDNIDAFTKRKYSYAQILKYKLKKGDILIEKSGGGEKTPVGRAVLFDKAFTALFANFMDRLRFNNEIVNPYFIEYWLRAWYYCGASPYYINQTIGIQNINLSLMLAKQIIFYPPLAEQGRIAEFLDAKCAEVDALAGEIKEQIATLEEYKRSVITEAVTKGLDTSVPMKDSGIEWIGEIPQAWDLRKGKYVLQYLQKPVRIDDEVITCFRDGQVTLRGNRREDGFTMADKEIGYQGIDEGDLVVHGMDGFAGAIGISDCRGKASPVLNVLDTRQNKRYVMFYLRSLAYRDVFLALSTGIRVRSCDLRWNKLAELFYLIPPLAEQEQIVAKIDEMLAKVDALIAEKQNQLATLEEYKKSVIFEYVTGKKEVV